MTAIITYLLTSKAAQAIGALLLALIAWRGNGAWRERKGRLAERKADAARDAARDAAQTIQQHKERDDVESDIRPANAADELRTDWKR